MAAVVQPALSGMSWERIEEMLRQHCVLNDIAHELTVASRELREISRQLRYANADLRELLQETLLNALSRSEHRKDQAPSASVCATFMTPSWASGITRSSRARVSGGKDQRKPGKL